MYYRTKKFFRNSNLFYSLQFSFRQKNSEQFMPLLALLKVLEKT